MPTGRRINLSARQVRMILAGLNTEMNLRLDGEEVAKLLDSLDDGSAPNYSGSIILFPVAKETEDLI